VIELYVKDWCDGVIIMNLAKDEEVERHNIASQRIAIQMGWA
jgi:hypothetical protein